MEIVIHGVVDAPLPQNCPISHSIVSAATKPPFGARSAESCLRSIRRIGVKRRSECGSQLCLIWASLVAARSVLGGRKREECFAIHAVKTNSIESQI
jgi:hypothetical protein